MSSNTTTKSNYFSTLKYFRNSIIESERRQIKQKPYFNAATKIAFKNLMKGHIDAKIAAKLVDQYNRKLEKESEKNGFLCINYKDEGLPDKIETSNFVSKAEEYFKHKAEEHFGQSFTSIKQIKELLHDKITSKNEIL